MIHAALVNNITDDLIQELKLNKEDKLLECYLDKQKIGYAIIRKDDNNKLSMVIDKEYQNKGYGSIIFKYVISKIEKPIKCMVPLDNFKMQRILKKNNGIEIGRNGTMIQYIIDEG